MWTEVEKSLPGATQQRTLQGIAGGARERLETLDTLPLAGWERNKSELNFAYRHRVPSKFLN